MGSNQRHYFILFEYFVAQLPTKKIRASPHLIRLHEGIHVSFRMVDGISPHQIAQEASDRNLPETVNFLDRLKLF